MTSEKETQKSTVEKKEKKKRTGGIAAFSLLISLFDKLGEIIYNTVIEGFFGNIFTAYTKTRNHFSRGFFRTYVLDNKKIKYFFRKINNSFNNFIELILSTH